MVKDFLCLTVHLGMGLPRGRGALQATKERGRVPAPQEGRTRHLEVRTHASILAFGQSGGKDAGRNTHTWARPKARLRSTTRAHKHPQTFASNPDAHPDVQARRAPLPIGTDVCICM